MTTYSAHSKCIRLFLCRLISWTESKFTIRAAVFGLSVSDVNFNFYCFVYKQGFCFLQVWSPTVLGSSGHCVLLDVVSRTLCPIAHSKNVQHCFVCLCAFVTPVLVLSLCIRAADCLPTFLLTFLHLFVCLSSCLPLPACMSVFLPAWQSACLYVSVLLLCCRMVEILLNMVIGGINGRLASPSVCLPACLSTCLSVFLPACLYVCLPASACMSVCLSSCLPVHLSVCLLVCPHDCLSSCLSAHLSSCFSACMSVCLPACLPACLSVCLFVFCIPVSASMTVFLCASMFACLSVCVPACLSACLHTCLCLPVCWHVCLPFCLPAFMPASLPPIMPACVWLATTSTNGMTSVLSWNLRYWRNGQMNRWLDSWQADGQVAGWMGRMSSWMGRWVDGLLLQLTPEMVSPT